MKIQKVHTVEKKKFIQLVVLGLQEDIPEAHQILSKFNWTEDDMGEVMIAIKEGEKEEVAAQNLD